MTDHQAILYVVQTAPIDERGEAAYSGVDSQVWSATTIEEALSRLATAVLALSDDGRRHEARLVQVSVPLRPEELADWPGRAFSGACVSGDEIVKVAVGPREAP